MGSEYAGTTGVSEDVDGDDKEGIKRIVDGDLASGNPGSLEVDAVSGDVEWLVGCFGIHQQLPLASGHHVADGGTEDSESCRPSLEVEDHGRE